MDMVSWERHLRAIYDQGKPYLVDVPTGKKGAWRLEHFETEMGVQMMHFAFRDGRPVGLGRYSKLVGPTGLFMTDTPAEVRDIRGALPGRASGALLVSGLGLGLLLQVLYRQKRLASGSAKKPKDEPEPFHHVTILEKEQDVVDLVAQHYLKRHPGLRVICADAFTWEPDRKFDWAWHDIWPDMCADYLPQMAKLRRRYAKHMTAPKRQLCWAEHQMRRDR